MNNIIDIDAGVRSLTISAILGTDEQRINIELRAKACEERREEVKRGDSSHHCPSYVHCLLVALPNTLGVFPICPIQVVQCIKDIKIKCAKLNP